MRLITGTGHEFIDPTTREIRETLSQLRVDDGDAFAILEQTEMSYLQCSGDMQVGFDLEYQLGDTDAHFRAERTNYTLEEIVTVFAAYRDRRVDWDAHVTWSRLDI